MIDWHFALGYVTHDDRFRLRIDTTAQGRVVGIFGPSGSGKSSFIEALLGWTPTGAADGDVICAGLSRAAAMPVARRGLVWAPQDAPVVLTQTVTKNAALGDPEAAADRIAAVLAAVEITDAMRRAGDLSGGERQRLSLARAVLGADRQRRLGVATPLLLLDEPLGAVDHKRRLRILKWLRRELEAHDSAALFVSHAWDEVESFCDHALILADGRLAASGIPTHLRPATTQQ